MSVNIDEFLTFMFAIRSRLHDQAKAEGGEDYVSILRLKTLHYVSEHSPVSMSDLADFLGVAPPSATTLVNSLVKSKQLARSTDAKDRRSVHLTVTAQGQKTMTEAKRRLASRIRQLLGQLDHHEQQTLMTILRKIAQPQDTEEYV